MLSRLRTLAAGMSAWSILPTLCFAVLPAIVVRGKWLPVAADATELWGEYFLGDIRTWWKSAFAIGIAAWMICMAACRAACPGAGVRRAGQRRFALLIAAAAGAVLAATWLSPFPHTRWIGHTALYEGALVFLAYLVAAWHASGTERPSARLLVVRSVLIVAAVNIALGVLAGVNLDFWQTGPGAWVIGIPRSMIRHNFAGSGMASGTAYQPNHYGMLMSMLGALSLGMAFAEGTRAWRGVWGAAYALSFIALLFSRSRAGTMVLAALTLLLVAAKACELRRLGLSRLRLPRAAMRNAALAAVPAVALAAVLSHAGLGDAVGSILGRRVFYAMPGNPDILDVSLADNVISVKAGSGTVEIGKLSPTVWYAAPGGVRREVLRFGEAGPERVAALPGLAGATLRLSGRGNVLLRCSDAALEFFTLGAEIFAVDRTKTNLRLLAGVPASAYRPNGYEGVLSARGYIWARTAGLWLERPWLGWGPGSLPLVFPNAELLNKRRYSFGEDEDKAHSLFLAFLVQTGVVGTILFFLPFAFAFLALARRSGPGLRLPLLLAMSAYAACGLTNDSTAGVTPLFCVFAGLAVAEAGDGNVMEPECASSTKC